MPFKNLAELKKHTLGEMRQDILRVKRKIVELRKDKLSTIAAFRRIVIKNGFEPTWESMDAGYYMMNYYINVTSPDFKNEKLQNVVQYLDDNFQNIENNEYTYGEILEKNFSGTKNGVRVKIEFRSSESESCRRILVETKMVEQPVYRIQCD